MPREMKASGIEWLGSIPSSWALSKLGTLYTERKTKVSDLDYPPLSVTMKGIVPQLATAAKTDAHDDRKLVCVGDFAINSRSDRRGSCGISAYDGSVSLINTILTPRKSMNPRYYNWLFHTSSFADEFYSWGHGIVDDLWTTNWQDMKRIQIPVPPLAEQEAIADFLDKQCAEIDAVTEKTKATIEEYKALKQSVITEAVTKGIRGDRPMKESGIEWIGEIPAEWELSRLKMMFSFGKGLPITKENLIEEGTSVISYGQIHSKTNSGTSINESLIRYVSDSYIETNAESLVSREDFIFADTSEDLDGCGNCVYVDNDSTLFAGYHTIIVRSNDRRNNKYFAYLFKTDCWRRQIRSKVSGVKLFSISKRILSETALLLPPIEEQEAIVSYLDQKCAKIDTLIEKKTLLIEEMEKLKKSIIFDYVTGKKEVTSATEEAITIAYPYFPSAIATNRPRFAQAVLMSKILDSNVSYMGRVKLEKMLFTIEHSLGFDFDTEYSREAAGPLDSSIYECEKVVSRANKWFYVNASDYGVSYKPQKDMSKYKKYYEQYFSDYNNEIERIIAIFRKYSLDQAEIVATLYGAWNDFVIEKRDYTDEDIVNDVLNNWNDSKKRFSKDVWLRAIENMRKNNLVPKGYGKHTVINPNC